MENLKEMLINALYMLPVCLLSLSLHEFSHGLVAYKLGDTTARDRGRLTLNPLKHIDIFGFIALMLFRFGWAKPVPVNISNLKKPKRDMAIIALAGPVSNLCLALVFALLHQFFYLVIYANYTPIAESEVLFQIVLSVNTLLSLFVMGNIGLCIFNLIPIVPFDGSRILYAFLPYQVIHKIQPFEKYIQLALIVFLLLGFLTGPLSVAVQAVSGWIYKLMDIIIPLNA